MRSVRGQVFVSLIIFALGLIIFILAAPIVATIINETVDSMGSATRFVVKGFLWGLIIVFLAVFFRIIGSGEGFLA